MTGSGLSTAWTQLRRRLHLTEPPGARPSVPTPPGAELPAETSHDELIRRIRGPRAEEDALPSSAPAWQTAELDEQELGASLALGVGRGAITADGLDWLIRRRHPDAATVTASPTPPPPTSSGPGARGRDDHPSPTPPSSRRSRSGGTGAPRRRSSSRRAAGA